MIKDDCRIVSTSKKNGEDTVLFHVAAKHSWETCGGNDTSPPPIAERTRWVEGNDDVKVLGAWVNHPTHTFFAVIEATEYHAIHNLFRPMGLKGTVDILPIGDSIASRKEQGLWGN